MRLCSLRVDDDFELHGVQFYVHDVKPPEIFFYREDGDRRIRSMKYVELIRDPGFKISDKQKKMHDRNERSEERKRTFLMDTLHKDKSDVAKRKLEIIKPILTFELAKAGDMYAVQAFNDTYKGYLRKKETLETLMKSTLLERVGEKYDLTPRQIQRYLKNYYKHESEQDGQGIDGLISKAHLNPHSRSDQFAVEIYHPKKEDLLLDVIYIRKGPEYIPILQQVIKVFLLKKGRMSVRAVEESISLLCHANNLKPLGYDTVYKLVVERLRKDLIDRMNRGLHDLDDIMATDQAGNYAKAPLHNIQIDHKLVPMKLIDDETGLRINNVWLSLGIDVYSRKIWGFDLSPEAPSGHKVMKVIHHGICQKNTKEQYGTLNEWDIWGIPNIIYVDNGPDFTGGHVKHMVEDILKKQLLYRPVATPRFGAIIERFFRTIDQEFLSELLGFYKKGSTGAEMQEAKDEAVLTINDLRELLVRYIVDVYHHDKHKGLPVDYPTPAARYIHAIETMGYPEFLPPGDEEDLRIRLLPTEMKSYRRNGIRDGNVFYASVETSKFINTKVRKNCKVKVDTDDICKLYLLDPENATYIEIPAVSPPADELRGMSRGLFEQIRKELIAKGKITKNEVISPEKLIEGKRLIKERYQQMVLKNAKVRQQAITSGVKVTIELPGEKEQHKGSTLSKREQLIARLNAERNGNTNEE